MKKVLLASLCGLSLSACSEQADKLLGRWENTSGTSSITIKAGMLGFNYRITTLNAPQYLSDSCSSVVIFSNNGFNCFKFPNKTARIAYQAGPQAASDSLISDNVYSNTIEVYHRASQAPK